MANCRQTILDNLKSLLATIPEIKSVDEAKSSLTDLDVLELPVIFIHVGSEDAVLDDRAIISQENWEWKISLAVYAYDANMNTLLVAIHNKIYADKTLSGACRIILRDGATELTLDTEKSLKVLIMDYSVLYSHPSGIA